MAKIEINDSPDELGRIAYFLSSNNIKNKIVKDYRNHSAEDAEAYAALMVEFEEVEL